VGRIIKIALVVLGIRAFLRWRKKRRQQHEAAPAAPASDPADELRRKLAESRAEDGPGNGESAPDAPVDDRRAEVHEQGRAAVDEMKSSSEG
jgi:hypothetical protein